ncbi:WD40 repeat-containing protein [Nitzschia inconspicua]|uniref:WD40 repeat-containing protein n=1 Tax=Nitzschia inconspicua TaxID=303405 RepID=A0A9K3KT24_9STRA|nr:WD40 repeat-containing protein [Nitzschia inconspicua]
MASSSRKSFFYTTSAPAGLKRRPQSDRFSNNPCRHRRNSQTRAASKTTIMATTIGDRFVPLRHSSALMNLDFCRSTTLNQGNDAATTENHSSEDTYSMSSCESDGTVTIQKEFQRHLKSSMCNIPIQLLDRNARRKSVLNYQASITGNIDLRHSSHLPLTTATTWNAWKLSSNIMRTMNSDHDDNMSGNKIIRQLHQDAIRRQKISKTPIRVLDAPGLVNDFYLNLISWSADGVLALGLGMRVYLYCYQSKETIQLVDSAGTPSPLGTNWVTSVAWCNNMPGKSHLLAIGIIDGGIFLYDTIHMRRADNILGHSQPVLSLSFRPHSLTSGAYERRIFHHDLRAGRLPAHQYQTGCCGPVSGLSWDRDGKSLAGSGGDHTVCIWDVTMSAPQSSMRRFTVHSRSLAAFRPRLQFNEHTSEVKAMDWCLFLPHLLATGGGFDDGTIKVWNANTGKIMNATSTGKPVTGLLWSRQREHQGEIVTGHGDRQGELNLWRYNTSETESENAPQLVNIFKNDGYNHGRILGLAACPAGGSIASACNDDSVKFWKLNDKSSKQHRCPNLLPDRLTPILR